MFDLLDSKAVFADENKISISKHEKDLDVNKRKPPCQMSTSVFVLCLLLFEVFLNLLSGGQSMSMLTRLALRISPVCPDTSVFESLYESKSIVYQLMYDY